MTSKSSKYLPFVSLGIAAVFVAIDMFTTYTITDDMIRLLVSVIPITAGGGLINKGFEVFKAIKTMPKTP